MFLEAPEKLVLEIEMPTLESCALWEVLDSKKFKKKCCKKYKKGKQCKRCPRRMK